MPRTSNKPKTHACPFCKKTFAVINSVYGHVRSHHPGLKFSMEQSMAPKSATELKAGRLQKLKDEFTSDSITLEEYLERKAAIEDQYDIDAQKAVATLDLGRARNDTQYTIDYILQLQECSKLMEKISREAYAEAFIDLFKNQLQILQTDTGFRITYVNFGKLKSEAASLADVVKLFKLMVRNMLVWAASKTLPNLDDYGINDANIDAVLGPSKYYQELYNGLGLVFYQAKQGALAGAIESVIKQLDSPINVLSD